MAVGRHLVVAAFLTALVTAEGCALFPLAALGGSALSAGGSAIAKAGTEYAANGSVQRTFTSPLDDVHAATLETFDRTGIRVHDDADAKPGRRIVGEADHRTVKISLTPLTSELTQMKLVVKRNVLMRDRATASELVEQVDHALADRASVAKSIPCTPESSAGAGKTRRATRHRRAGPREPR